jgi:hypothetical protein
LRSIAVLVTATLVSVTAGAQDGDQGGAPACARCGPAPLARSWSCADGRHQGGRGPCTRLRDGSCGWIHLVCPEDRPREASGGACTAAECGPAPAFATWACPGERETGAFAACKRDREGRCGWIYRPCRGEAQAQQDGRPRPAVQRPPRAEPAPRPPRRCANLPGDDQLRSWPVVGVCAPGGGPAPAPTRRIRPLGDGTYVFAGRDGCFRGRYLRCNSK